jgi:hypothetical protein
MVTRKRGVVVAFFLAVTVGLFASAEGWKQFRSSKDFSVMYPETWFKIGVSSDRLALRSSRGGAEGVGIKRGQAEIDVMEAPESSDKTLSQVIDYYLFGASVLSRKDIVRGVQRDGSCSDLKEVVSKGEVVPAEDIPIPIPVPYFIYTGFFCEVDGHKIVTMLRNWKGDARQQQYQQVALGIAKSIHVGK